jgi:CheY-like chemotaxis protein
LAIEINQFSDDFDPRFKVFHELMQWKVRNILLVSSLYDACIMEEDCRLAERIINEYRGLNLSQPPRLTWVSSAEEALAELSRKKFELVLTMPRLAGMDAFALGEVIKQHHPDLPIILLSHAALIPECSLDEAKPSGIDRTFVWTGNSELLLAIIKSVEDSVNVVHDTETAGVRVVLFVEDSPVYLSAILPILYREVVGQTQSVLEEGLNEEHRLLTMRARAKFLIAQNYEEAMELYEQYKPFLLGVISDVSFPRNCELDNEAGVDLMKTIKAEIPDIPLLLTSSEPSNREKAEKVSAEFIDKNSPSLVSEIRQFFLKRLGFGDFVFRKPDGKEVARVSSRRSLEKILPSIPDESFVYHWSRNDFSRWLFARTETALASRLRPVTAEDFESNVEEMREFLISFLRARRRRRQKGVVVDFDTNEFDPDMDFFKIGKGSLGGKARGLAFISTLLQRTKWLHEKYPDVDITIPHTLVITTEAFDQFIEANDLRQLSKTDAEDEEIARQFLEARFSEAITEDLRSYLFQVTYPLAVRSSGLLEDALFRAYAGLYSTYMIPNSHHDLEVRLSQLISAIKLVYASTYFRGPKAFANRVGQRTEEEKMAVIIQQLVGERHNGYFYPAISGVAQSHNYYPFGRMKPEEGSATVALGLGQTVVEGGKALRFSPKHPQLLPQFSTVEDILENAQRTFYALKMNSLKGDPGEVRLTTLTQREVTDATTEDPVRLVASTYVPEEHRLKDVFLENGTPVVTFAPILKYKQFPLSGILADILPLAHEGMGCPVEIEFSVELCPQEDCQQRFAFLQLRPMTARAELREVDISTSDIEKACCYSTNALGNANRSDMADILYIKPEAFDPAQTMAAALEIGKLNASLSQQGRQYLLIGPGRWGSADRWLGIPVAWADISSVGAMVETTAPDLKAEPSQGSHFFHNVTTLGINYLTVGNKGRDFIHWDRLKELPVVEELRYVAHVALEKPFTLKVDGRKSIGVIIVPDNDS